jgi:acyl-CoA thioesterase YciA
VFAERNRLDAEIVKVTEATLTYVATDNERRPRSVPPTSSDSPFCFVAVAKS